MHRYHCSNKESNIKTATIHRHIGYNPISAVLQCDLSTTLRFPIHCCGIPARRTTFYLFIVHTEKKASNTIIEGQATPHANFAALRPSVAAE